MNRAPLAGLSTGGVIGEPLLDFLMKQKSQIEAKQRRVIDIDIYPVPIVQINFKTQVSTRNASSKA